MKKKIMMPLRRPRRGIFRHILRILSILRAEGATEEEVLEALVEREVDRARRTFGMFFEIFSQKGSAFAPNLCAHD